ncbi:MAG: hypothetical protein JWM95_2712 [Gemmatimonadetes bacterium]|nr:hypothetical protein [Gemmatimonadota bacterium]
MSLSHRPVTTQLPALAAHPVGVWFILAALAALACYEPTTPAHQPLAIIATDTGTADGASLTAIAVIVDSLTPSDKRSVALTTTAGTFTSGGLATATLAPDDNGTARALLRAPSDSTTAILSATVNGSSVSTLIVFRRAQPQSLTLEPAQYEVKSSSATDVAVTATLFRAVGTPSAPMTVTFSVVDTAAVPSPRGVFLPADVQSNSAGVAKTRFTLADSSYRGPLVLRATVLPSGVTSTATIQIVGAPSSTSAP